MTYTRSSALFDLAERRLETHAGEADEGQLALRDFKLIDGAMAGLADNMVIERTDFDTTAVLTVSQPQTTRLVPAERTGLP